MKRLIIAALLLLTACQKELVEPPKPGTDPDVQASNIQPTYTDLTAIILYAGYQFDFNWSYHFYTDQGGFYSVGYATYVVHGGGGSGHTVTQQPVAVTVNGNIIKFIFHVRDSYHVMIYGGPRAGDHETGVDTVVTVTYNMTTKTYTVTGRTI